MIAGIFHSGSGLGNQLHRYVATRVLALDKGYGFSMITPENFKGGGFMSLDMGIENTSTFHTEMPAGKVVVDRYAVHHQAGDYTSWEEKTEYYNPEFNFTEDNTVIDGEFQDERYFGHRLNEVHEWLKVEALEIPDDTCVIGFRGGEFAVFPELFLTRDYWDDAIDLMRSKGITKFEVHTDDPELAKKYFDNRYPVIHDIGINWRSMRCAKNAIIANSSFYIFPRLLCNGLTIAPRYWARRNTKEWSKPQNYYKSFWYI